MKSFLRHIVALLIGLCALIATLVIPAEALAQNVRGYIERKGTDLYLDINSPEAPRRIVARPDVMAELGRLRTGDFISARGAIEALDYVVRVDTIESVGLQELLGPWSSVNFEVYEFQNFTRLNLYEPTKEVDGVVLSKTAEFNYILAPDQGQKYSIFLSDNRSVVVGTLEIKRARIRLMVIDPKTGRVAQNISLSPLPVK